MPKPIDLTGQKFGRWTALRLDSSRSASGRTRHLCRCDCGNERLVDSQSLIRKREPSKSCGCLKNETNTARRYDLKGQNFGSLTVIEFVSGSKTNRRGCIWKCQCDCGNTKLVYTSDLMGKKTVSCGCRINKTPQGNPKLSTAKQVWRNKYHDGNITFEQFLNLSQLPCFYCGRLPSNSQNRFARGHRKAQSRFSDETGTFVYNGLDRVNSCKPHDLNNVVSCCKHCNRAKLAMTAEEFSVWLKQTTAHHLYQMTADELNEAIALWKAQKENGFQVNLEAV